ncbi:GerAB/ArcD/ProY family transporter [Paenibacillus humicola]|uniref:GerAB/ArcD/ProY family transporter n=1 Tax=Paenibacillus humicola TaxID=3110540 RepID=UPI00237C1E2B|nr:endospore germination permease [Paenibacillus humicola]
MKQLTSLQIYWLNFSFQIGMTLTVLTTTIAKAKQDAWLSVLIAGLISIGIAYIVVRASLLHPGQTFVQLSQTILGKWLGRLVVLPYILLWFGMTGTVLRYGIEFIHTALFRNTPLSVLMFTMLLLVAHVGYSGGLRAIAMCSELMGPLILLTIAVLLLLNTTNIDWRLLQPVLAERDMKSMALSVLAPISLMGEVMAMLGITAFAAKPAKVMASIMWSMISVVLLISITVVMIIVTFGPVLSARMWFAFYDMVRLISIGEFIQNVDVFMLIIWMSSVFIKLSLFFFLTCHTTAQWLEIRDWRKLVWIAVPAVFASSLLSENMLTMLDFNPKYHVPFGLPINYFMVPLLLLGVGLLRGKKTGKSGPGGR